MATNNSSVEGQQSPISDGLQERLVSLRRTAKVVKGGRTFSFSAFVVVGDGSGKIGFGHEKAREVSSAITKATQRARRNMCRVKLNGRTIQHPVISYYGATKVIMLPASDGTGLIAGGAMRAVCDVMGIHDVLAKCVGSRNPLNVVRAAINGLLKMQSPEVVARRRGREINPRVKQERASSSIGISNA